MKYSISKVIRGIHNSFKWWGELLGEFSYFLPPKNLLTWEGIGVFFSSKFLERWVEKCLEYPLCLKCNPEKNCPIAL